MTTRIDEVRRFPIARPALRDWQRSTLILVGLFFLPFVVFAGLATAREVLYFHDVQYYFIPYHELVKSFFEKGWLPLWNPYAFSGIPLLGDGQTAMFYPPNWLFLILPVAVAMNYVVLIEFSLAGTGMFVFGRGLGLGRTAATLAALAYMFNGFLTTRVVHLSIMSGAALIPFVFWSADWLRRQPGPRSFTVAALMVGLQALAGHPQIPVYTGAALVIYLVVREALSPGAARGRRVLLTLGRLVATYVVGYALGGIQLLPWVDFARL